MESLHAFLACIGTMNHLELPLVRTPRSVTV